MYEVVARRFHPYKKQVFHYHQEAESKLALCFLQYLCF